MTIPPYNDPFPPPTGVEIFTVLSPDEQDAKIGTDAAELVREGKADLKDFVGHSRLATDQPNFITQKPVKDAA